MRVRSDLPKPTMDLVKSMLQKFDADNSALESGLTKLISCFPKNEDLGQVLVKAAAINALYYTQIRGLFEVAKTIINSRIDVNLELGADDAVNLISKVAYGSRTRWNYSFATKYCSWHQPELFPIYDSRVDFCLRSYRAKDQFAKFTQDNLWDYGQFRAITRAFQAHYGLESLTAKELDKFLYQLGNEYLGMQTSDASGAAS